MTSLVCLTSMILLLAAPKAFADDDVVFATSDDSSAFDQAVRKQVGSKAAGSSPGNKNDSGAINVRDEVISATQKTPSAPQGHDSHPSNNKGTPGTAGPGATNAGALSGVPKAVPPLPGTKVPPTATNH